MKTLVLDAGPVISLVTDNLLWILEELKKKFKVNFVIGKAVRTELVENALKIRRFMFEGMFIDSYIKKETIKLTSNDLNYKLEFYANNIFLADGQPLQLLHKGEIESLLLCKKLNADALVIDERTTRLLIEDYERLRQLLEKKLECKIKINKENLDNFLEEVKDIKIIRSAELLFIAYESGLFDNYKNSFKKKDLLNGILWGTKLRGCSISEEEIKTVVEKFS